MCVRKGEAADGELPRPCPERIEALTKDCRKALWSESVEDLSSSGTTSTYLNHARVEVGIAQGYQGHCAFTDSWFAHFIVWGAR